MTRIFHVLRCVQIFVALGLTLRVRQAKAKPDSLPVQFRHSVKETEHTGIARIQPTYLSSSISSAFNDGTSSDAAALTGGTDPTLTNAADAGKVKTKFQHHLEDSLSSEHAREKSTSGVVQRKRSPPIGAKLYTSLSRWDVQSAAIPSTQTSEPTGSIIPTLESAGHATDLPFNSATIAAGTKSITPLQTGAAPAFAKFATPPSMSSNNLFTPLEDNAPPNNIAQRKDHPVPRLGIIYNASAPLQTNKFYANFFLGDRLGATWTHPYSVAWSGGGGQTGSWGISVSHIDRDQLAYGPGNPVQFFINPIGLQSVVISAQELQNGSVLTLDTLTGFSINVNLAINNGSAPLLRFPLVQGMGYVTGVYTNATPMLQSGLFFITLTYGGLVNGPTARYTARLNDGKTWLVYITSSDNRPPPILTLISGGTTILGSRAFNGTLQVAKVPVGSETNGTLQALYDGSAGIFPITAKITGRADKATATYTFIWTKGGIINRPLLMFALPHHVQSFSAGTAARLRTFLQLQTTTKGMATAMLSDTWTMVENDVPYNMEFAPWSPSTGSRVNLPPAAVSLINSVAAAELSQDMNAQTNLNSMYYAGKGLAKFAMIIYATDVLANNASLALAGLENLRACFARFVNNTQIFPLVYESAWGGAVSSASYTTGDSGADFGETYYNDLHFHFGYFVYTAAVIAYLDPAWLDQGTNKAWVTMLIRDYANPSTTDGYFPFSRMFDWYHGHSWAHGLFESYDGKDQESSSEDAFASYALKMWGYVTGDANTEARGNLMLALQARSFRNYYLMQTDNTVQPSNFIGNRAAGIIFENKIDHTTYFGNNISFIEGIHMLPLNPSSPLTRPSAFVKEEWNTYFSNGRVDKVSSGGWKGILYANLAIWKPKLAWHFFAYGLTEEQRVGVGGVNVSESRWSDEWLDGGASRTWYLAWVAGLGGAD